MLEKIDKFIDKFLSWEIFKYVLLAELFLIPHAFVASIFNISSIPLIIMDISYGISIAFFNKAILKMSMK